MRTIKGPALLIAQLASDRPPFNSLPGIAKWAASLGYKGLQLPSSDTRFLDLHRCAESQTYADEITGTLKEHGLAATELVTALQGQLVAVHPAYDVMCDAFAPSHVQGNPKARQVSVELDTPRTVITVPWSWVEEETAPSAAADPAGAPASPPESS